MFTMKFNIKKTLIITILILIFLFVSFSILIFVFKILVLFGKIQEYTYLDINNNNKEKIIGLLQEQEDDMFSEEGDISLNDCYKKLNRIEVIFHFPDGESYTLYCGENKISFSLDSVNYNLPSYMGKNGKTGYRPNW